ncbi:acyl carrier protein [Streptomyces sp. NPDC028635]|uniref:acyl carrier protein n=1 Tax=Streptomyces sp. NPDC028635 TaxID=3154800 RepID=UPI0033EA8657
MPRPSQHLDEADVRHWLVSRIVAYLGGDARTLDLALPFSEHGLDSLAAFGLCGDIEEEYGVVLEPTAAWDHPTVAALSRHVVAHAAPQPGGTPER